MNRPTHEIPDIPRPADNSRIAGWDQLRARLVGMDDRPALFMFSTCTHLIRTFPTVQHDEHKPEDLDSDSDDHCLDALRYGVMSRPWQAPLAKLAKNPDSWERAFARDDDYGANNWKTR